MRGVKTSAALSAALVCAWFAARAEASEFDGVRALAREKAAAVGILKSKAADAVVTLAQDRLFVAYLNATTQGEGARLKTRIGEALATLIHRFGLGEVAMIDRSGEFVVGAGRSTEGEEADVRKDAALAAGFAQEAHRVSSVLVRGAGASSWTISHVAPINWHDQNEFALRAEQDGAAYQRVLALGGDARRYVVLVDQNGRVLSDSRPGHADKSPLTIAGLPLRSLRQTLRGNAQEGSGQVSRRDEHFNVSYRAVDGWTVVAVEAISAPHRCAKNGGRLCG